MSTMEPDQDLVNEFVGAAHGDFARVQELLTAHPGLLHGNAVWTETAIEAAAQMGRRDIAEYLLAAGAPLALCTAAVLGRAGTVAAMLAADPGQAQATGAHGIPALYFPAIAGRPDIAAQLHAAGAAVNAGAGGTTPLHGAALFGQTEMAAWLLDHGAAADAVNYEGQTPREVALAQGHAAVADLLAARGGAG